jgi:hypothetical protein
MPIASSIARFLSLVRARKPRMETARKEIPFVLAGAALIAALTMAILHIQRLSLAYSYRDGVDAIGMLRYVREAGFSFSIPFVNLETLGGFAPQNAWLSPSQWPALVFGTHQSVLEACYGLCALELYLSTYLLARRLGSPWDVAALGGLLLPLFALPLVWSEGPFSTLLTFSPILGDVIVLNNLLLAGLAGIFIAERPKAWAYVLFGASALWFTLLAPLSVVLVVPLDAVVYGVLSLRAARTPRFWSRQFLLLALLAALLALLGPHLFGLFANTSSSLFKSELIGDTFTNPWPYVPAPFRNLSNAIATFALVLLLWAVHQLWKGKSREFLTVLIWILAAFGTFALLHSALFVLVAKGNATFPRPSYFEIVSWPFYGLWLASICAALWRRFCAAPSLAARPALHGYLLLALFAAFGVLMMIVTPQRFATTIMPYRPAADPIVQFLQARLGPLDGPYAGQVATFAGGVNNVGDLLAYDRRVGRSLGNAHRGETLRYFGVRTLDEDSATISPTKYLLLTRFLARPQDEQTRATLVFTKPAQAPLAALGVRYVVTDQPLPAPATLRLKEEIAGTGTHFVYELENVNLGTYAPTVTRVAGTPEAQLRAILQPDFDFRRDAIVDAPVPPLSPAKSAFFAHPGGYRIHANSEGTSLIVLPVIYSNCLRWQNEAPGAPARLIRVDFGLTGLLFDRQAKGRIAPAQSPFVNPFCGIADWRTMRSLSSRVRDIWPAGAR